jgi:F0F1-type ATP synthase assembly protein I
LRKSHDVTSENWRNVTSSRNHKAHQVSQAYQTAHEILATSIYLGFLIWVGFKADQKLGSTPIFTVCGACLGLIASVFSLRRILRQLEKESASRKRQKTDKG